MNIIDKLLRIKVAFGRGYVWYAVMGIPFLVARDAQDMLKESLNLTIPLWQVALIALIPLAIISVLDYKFLMSKENALFLEKNDEWNKKK